MLANLKLKLGSVSLMGDALICYTGKESRSPLKIGLSSSHGCIGVLTDVIVELTMRALVLENSFFG